MTQLNRTIGVTLARELRMARLSALEDAEAFPALAATIEQVARHIHEYMGGNPKKGGLGDFKHRVFEWLDQQGDLAAPERAAQIYRRVQGGRNDAAHEGAYARSMTRDAINLALILENAFMCAFDCKEIRDYMTPTPVQVEPWQSIRQVRRTMLHHSFSFLPIRWKKGWRVISDQEVARCLWSDGGPAKAMCLSQSVKCAVEKGWLSLTEPSLVVAPSGEVPKILKTLDGKTSGVILVVQSENELAGIATPFDLL